MVLHICAIILPHSSQQECKKCCLRDESWKIFYTQVRDTYVDIHRNYKPSNNRNAQTGACEFLGTCNSLFTPLNFQTEIYDWNKFPWFWISEPRQNSVVSCTRDLPLRTLTAFQSARQKCCLCLKFSAFSNKSQFMRVRCPLGCITLKKLLAANWHFLSFLIWHLFCCQIHGKREVPASARSNWKIHSAIFTFYNADHDKFSPMFISSVWNRVGPALSYVPNVLIVKGKYGEVRSNKFSFIWN